MHPLISRFLDVQAAAAVLASPSEPVGDPQALALYRTARGSPSVKADVVAALGHAHPPPRTEQELLVLTARAAASLLESDEQLGPAAREARRALEYQLATPAQIDELLAQVLLDEAFAYATDPTSFDVPLVAETLESLGPLAELSEDRVAEWLEQFALEGPREDRPLRLRAAEVLFNAAWADGPEPVTPEHVDEAAELVRTGLLPAQHAQGRQVLEELLRFLHGRGVVGRLRLDRLVEVLRSTASDGDQEDAEDEEEDEEDEEDATP